MAYLTYSDQNNQPGESISQRLLKYHSEAIVEAVEILIKRPDAVRTVLTR